jgi:NAD(P)-dependent dehydrogenase (short-subunit alcohol dehydrogenase family)
MQANHSQTEKQQRVALVTGASSGIGKATAVELLRNGYTVYAAARRPERMANLEALGAHLVVMDVARDASMVEAVDRIAEKERRIDVLINNAGFGSYGAIEDVALEAARYQMEVNVFGAARLIQLVLPMMRRQRSGKIVNVSSTGGKVAFPVGGWYHASKFALEALSDSLRLEVKPFGIDVIVIEPGGVKTEWADIAAEHMQRTSSAAAYADLVSKTTSALRRVEPRGADPQVIARLIVEALGAKRPRSRYHAGFLAGPVLWLRRILPDRVLDHLIGAQLRIKPAPRVREA